MAQLLKNTLAMWETWILSLGWEDPLEKGKATLSSILVWRIPMTIQSMGLQRVGHNLKTFTFTCLKYSLGISNFLEEISSLSHSIVFLFPNLLFCTDFTEEGFFVSPCYFLELCILMGISFLSSITFHFSSFLSYFLLGDIFDHCLLYRAMNLCP